MYDIEEKSYGKIFKVVGTIIVGALFCVIASQATDTVNKGEYHIVQQPITGKMQAEMTPGMYWRWWGSQQVWPVSETFYFTSDVIEGSHVDQSIEVRFNDGSIANVSGTSRVLLPSSESQAIALMRDLNYQSYKDLEFKLILPVVRKALRNTASMMDARESYAERRQEFIAMVQDQILNGVYITEEHKVTIVDEETGKTYVKHTNVISKDSKGQPLREPNLLSDNGLSIANLDIKKFVYSPKVTAQIEEQQQNMMAIATARAQAEKAKQDAKTEEAKGEADLMKVRYEKMQEKERARIAAEQAKEVAIIKAEQQVDVAEKNKEQATIQAEQLVEVAKLEKEAAEQTKQKLILEGEGEATKKKLIMQADGALQQKLDAYVTVNEYYAKAISEHTGNWVPQVVMGSSNGDSSPNAANDLIELLKVKTAKDLALNITPK